MFPFGCYSHHTVVYNNNKITNCRERERERREGEREREIGNGDTARMNAGEESYVGDKFWSQDSSSQHW